MQSTETGNRKGHVSLLLGHPELKDNTTSLFQDVFRFKKFACHGLKPYIA